MENKPKLVADTLSKIPAKLTKFTCSQCKKVYCRELRCDCTNFPHSDAYDFGNLPFCLDCQIVAEYGPDTESLL